MKKNFTLCFLLLCFSFLVSAQIDLDVNEGIVSQRLLRQMEESPSEKLLVYTLLEDQVDVYTMGQTFDQQRTPVPQRVATLIASLKSKANETQPAFINDLKNIQGLAPSSIKPYWITNVVFVEANAEAIATISRRSDVLWMDINVENEIDATEDIDCAMPPVPNGTEPGLRAINAPALWAMGYTGYGQIAFTSDTGIDPDHPAINFKYRGLYADNSETWVDFNNAGNVITANTTPTNCGDHGNHTTGTILGLDRITNDTIGVAFGSNWIGTAILCGIGTADNIGAFQWALDPDGDPNTIEDMPDVINNSWWDPSLDPFNECGGVYVSVLTALEVAGIANIFSAGNDGSAASTITRPKNINTDTLNSFTVGALNGNNSSFPITDFSSQGPSICGGEGSLLIKPEVSAPGQSVRSCELDGTYGSKSGTSMAAPHVAGAVLLLKEAFPNLTGKDLLRAIYHSCTDLGDAGEDNTYGMGIINVLSAFNLLVSQGHVPVSPYVATDALMVGFDGDNTSCTGDVNQVVVFENAGTDTLTSLDLIATITRRDGTGTPIMETINWTGVLAPKERASTVVEVPVLSNGYYLMEVTLSNPNGIADEKPLNNKGYKIFDLYASEDYNVYLGGFSNVTPCAGSSANLYSDYEGEGKIKWYSSPTSSVSVHEGNYYTTPVLNFDFTYYTELVQTHYAGEESIDTASMNNLITNGGMIFDADFDFYLASVKVYPEAPGIRYLNIFDSDNELIASKAMILFEAGEQRVDVGINIPAGQNMRITIGDTGSFLPYSGNASYPYTIGDDLGTVKFSTQPGAPLNNWFYFYDWEVEVAGSCARKSVFIEVGSTMEDFNAQFSSSTDFVNFVNNEPVEFTNESVGASEYLWTFGDGNSSTEENPSHLYETEGVFDVTLTVLGVDNCSDSYTQTVTVESVVNVTRPGELLGRVDVYPNPVNDLIQIKYQFEKNETLQLKVMDALGRTIYEVPAQQYTHGQQLIDCSLWSNGLYYMVFTNGKDILTKKVVRMDY